MISVLYQIPITGGSSPATQLADAQNALSVATMNSTLEQTYLVVSSDATVINGPNIEKSVDFTEAAPEYQNNTIGPSETTSQRDAKRLAVIVHMFDAVLSKLLRRRVEEIVTLGVYPI